MAGMFNNLQSLIFSTGLDCLDPRISGHLSVSSGQPTGVVVWAEDRPTGKGWVACGASY